MISKEKVAQFFGLGAAAEVPAGFQIKHNRMLREVGTDGPVVTVEEIDGAKAYVPAGQERFDLIDLETGETVATKTHVGAT